MSINSAFEFLNEDTDEFVPYITDSSIVSAPLKNRINDLQNTVSELENIINGLAEYAEG